MDVNNFFKQNKELMEIANRLAKRELSEYGKKNFQEPLPCSAAISFDVYRSRNNKPRTYTNRLTKMGRKYVERIKKA